MRPWRSARLMMMVLASGMSRPFSMMRGRDQHVVLVVHEGEHDLLQLGLAHLAVADDDARLRAPARWILAASS